MVNRFDKRKTVLHARNVQRVVDVPEPVKWVFPESKWCLLPEESKDYYLAYANSRLAPWYLETDYQGLMMMTLLHAKIMNDGLSLKSLDVGILERLERRFGATLRDRLGMNVLVRRGDEISRESGDRFVASGKPVFLEGGVSVEPGGVFSLEEE